MSKEKGEKKKKKEKEKNLPRIVFPEPDPNRFQSVTRRILKNNPTLSWTFLSLTQVAPARVSEVAEFMIKTRKVPIDRTTVYRALKKLNQLELVTTYSTRDVFFSSHNNPIYAKIKKKHTKYLQRFPRSIQKQYRNVLYFDVTEYGMAFVEWACECIGARLQGEKGESKT